MDPDRDRRRALHRRLFRAGGIRKDRAVPRGLALCGIRRDEGSLFRPDPRRASGRGLPDDGRRDRRRRHRGIPGGRGGHALLSDRGRAAGSGGGEKPPLYRRHDGDQARNRLRHTGRDRNRREPGGGPDRRDHHGTPRGAHSPGRRGDRRGKPAGSFGPDRRESAEKRRTGRRGAGRRRRAFRHDPDQGPAPLRGKHRRPYPGHGGAFGRPQGEDRGLYHPFRPDLYAGRGGRGGAARRGSASVPRRFPHLDLPGADLPGDLLPLRPGDFGAAGLFRRRRGRRAGGDPRQGSQPFRSAFPRHLGRVRQNRHADRGEL